MSQPGELIAIETWMQSAIAGPVTGTPTVGEMILPSSQLTSEERLAIYQRAYVTRLVECMRAEFPMVCRALGQEPFDELSSRYLAAHPSSSYTLSDLGRRFPDYLHASFPRDDDAATWYESIVDLAVLEWVTSEVFNGPGTEHGPPLDTSKFTPDSWDSLALSLAPCVRLLELRYPVNEYYRTLRAGDDAIPPIAGRTLLVVSRLDYTVRHNAVSEPQFALLKTIKQGGSLTAAIALAIERFSGDLDEFAAQLHGWFSWFAAERLLRIE